MSKYDWLLFFHLLGAFLLLGGALAYHTLHVFLLRRGGDRPSEVATLFGMGRPFELAIQVGAGAVLIFGIWLAYADQKAPKYKITDEWVIAAIVLWILGNALGFAGGRIYTEATELAKRLAAEGDAPSPELRTLIRSPRAALMTWTSTLAIITILVLMVWKPGAP